MLNPGRLGAGQETVEQQPQQHKFNNDRLQRLVLSDANRSGRSRRNGSLLLIPLQ
jgi:hypothetical protein